MTTGISIILFLIFAFLSALHFYWAMGGNWVRHSVFPTKDDNSKIKMPGAISSLIVALGLALIGLFILMKGDLFFLPVPNWMDKYGLWFISVIFILRAVGEFNYVGFFKKIKQTKFGKNDTKYYSPLCLVIGVMTLIMILSKLGF